MSDINKNPKARVGLVGWRGMVGSVLMERFAKEGDFKLFEPCYFSTSQAGQQGPDGKALGDGYDIAALAQLDAIVVCQGSDYSKAVWPKLKEQGYKGLWIDAASAYRLEDDAVICLDPVNGVAIEQALGAGEQLFTGGNCTVSLMLMAIGGLIETGLVTSIHAATYQAISGAGAKALSEMMAQTSAAGELFKAQEGSPALDREQHFRKLWQSGDFPTAVIGQSIVGSLLPWIDSELDDGSSREERKGYDETNKIMAVAAKITGKALPSIPVTSTCVRAPVFRCHSHALTISLKGAPTLAEIERIIAASNRFVEVVPNTRAATLDKLTPEYTTGKLAVPVGRLRTTTGIHGETILSAFTVGDQLLWGAAEPLRRTLLMALPHISQVSRADAHAHLQ